VNLALPAGFHVARIDLSPNDDRHECGREAARQALRALGEDPAGLAYEGTRPVVRGSASPAPVVRCCPPLRGFVSGSRNDVAGSELHAWHAKSSEAGVHAASAHQVNAEGVAVSITHGRRVALAVAARVSRLGIDLCDDDPRLPALAERFLVDERVLARSPLDLSACFAAKEAALKALGLGLVDGGVLDGTAIRVVSLSPPRLSDAGLHLALTRLGGAALAVVYG
jgi:phosphopantetheinyl transferase (holo-ACP synthase)